MWRAHPRKSWMDRSCRPASGDGRMTVVLLWIYFRLRQKIHGDYDDPTPCRNFRSFAQKSFPWPSPKYPPRRNGPDWHGLQRCGNHWDIFCFRHADKKRHIHRTVSRHPQHRKPWSAWLSGSCGGVAAISRALAKKAKPVKLGYGRTLMMDITGGKINLESKIYKSNLTWQTHLKNQ